MNFKNIPREKWPYPQPNLRSVWKNNEFLVQEYDDDGSKRLTINRINPKESEGELQWEENISWDDLQDIKNSLGYRSKWMVELYPPQEHVINDANMRHLWLIETPKYGWHK
jgi:hypothetical protein